jgi:predicted DNA-binding transcriptional regulator YafY
LHRLVAFDRMLRDGQFPNATIAAAMMEVHPRTIARDLAFPRDSLGAPLEFDHQKNGYFYQRTVI